MINNYLGDTKMAQKTLAFQGLAYGATPAVIQSTANGAVIFSGSVAAVDSTPPSMPISQGLLYTPTDLFTMTVDTAFSGTIPITHQVNNGTVIFSQILQNYSVITNPIYSQEQLAVLTNASSTRTQRNAIYMIPGLAVPTLNQTDIDVLENPNTTGPQYRAVLVEHNLTVSIQGGPTDFGPVGEGQPDPVSAVLINGLPVARGDDLQGMWWWTVPAGSTISFNLDVSQS
jgi:hypothetical protein